VSQRARGTRLKPPRATLVNEVDKAGYFAAWEEPEIFATELRAAFGSLHWDARVFANAPWRRPGFE
jgi:hypothetical protein